MQPGEDDGRVWRLVCFCCRVVTGLLWRLPGARRAVVWVAIAMGLRG